MNDSIVSHFQYWRSVLTERIKGKKRIGSLNIIILFGVYYCCYFRTFMWMGLSRQFISFQMQMQIGLDARTERSGSYQLTNEMVHPLLFISWTAALYLVAFPKKYSTIVCLYEYDLRNALENLKLNQSVPLVSSTHSQVFQTIPLKVILYKHCYVITFHWASRNYLK